VSLIEDPLAVFDVAVVGGGPAGLSAAMWCARYRRTVLLVDADEQRNSSAAETHGYLGLDGAEPAELVERAISDVLAYPEVTRIEGGSVTDVTVVDDAFDLRLADGRRMRALRLILATGVVDLLPDIAHFDEYYGATAFTCPTCDGYEAQGKRVVAIGDDDHISGFALGLLDWAGSVALIAATDAAGVGKGETARVEAAGVEVIRGTPVALEGAEGALRAVRLADGTRVECEVVFCTVRNVQHSDLPVRLGCEMSEEGCVIVDPDGRTSVTNVFAAGDMTPGPQLVQIAAAEGARAGIAAALSLRGERGAPGSPHPAPEPDKVLSASTHRA
jgi:thioredoxin reductase